MVVPFAVGGSTDVMARALASELGPRLGSTIVVENRTGGGSLIGAPLADVFGLNDPVIEINLTPNRADCAGVLGIARDLAAAGLGTLRSLNFNAVESTIAIDAAALTPPINAAARAPWFSGTMPTASSTSPRTLM